jgi:peptide/nickel transport system substrate-binding protein
MGHDTHRTAAITVGRVDDVTTLNPVLYGDLPTGEVVNRLFDHLVLTDPEGGYIPGRLLSHWEVSPDGLTWDFHLRRAARWHDGRPVTARDACCSFAAMLDPANASPRRAEFLVDGEPLRFAARSSHVLRISLPRPHAPLLAALAWRPLIPAHLYEDGAVASNPHNDAPVGSGAFAFQSWERGSELVMRANLDYHQGRAPLDRVSWRCFADREAAVEALLDGRVDYVPGLPPALVDTVQRARGLSVIRSVDGTFTFLGFRLARPPFGDVRVRRALHHAIDRERIVAQALRGEGDVAHSPVIASSPWHNPDVPRYAYDRRRAAELLDAAGWRAGSDGRRCNGDGRALRFTILTAAGDPVKDAAARAVAADLAAVGVSAHVERCPLGELLGGRAFAGDFDALLLGLTPGLDPGFLHGFYHSAMATPGGWNMLGYSNDAVDAALDAAQRATDRAERARLVGEAQAQIAADVPHVLLFAPVSVDGATNALSIPPLPRTPGNRFMAMHRWSITRRRAAPRAAGDAAGLAIVQRSLAHRERSLAATIATPGPDS